MKEKVTVLIADDNQEFSKTLSSYLESQPDMEVIGMARDGNEAIEMITNTNPDVVLLDVIMPHLDGIGVLEQINMIKMNKKPICIMLSAVGQDKITRRAIELGAEYYVVKPFDTKEVIARIKAVSRRIGQSSSESEIREVKYDKLVVNMTRYELRVDGKVMDTPPKELELLFYLASNPNRVYTRDQLLDEVWGFEYYGDSRTIDVHVKRLREKLEGASDKWSLKTVWGVGYKFEVKE